MILLCVYPGSNVPKIVCVNEHLQTSSQNDVLHDLQSLPGALREAVNYIYIYIYICIYIYIKQKYLYILYVYEERKIERETYHVLHWV